MFLQVCGSPVLVVVLRVLSWRRLLFVVSCIASVQWIPLVSSVHCTLVVMPVRCVVWLLVSCVVVVVRCCWAVSQLLVFHSVSLVLVRRWWLVE